MRGMISGLELDDSLDDLAAKFNVTLEAIALQTRHIVDEMNARGHSIDSIYMSGSQAKNKALMGLLATVLGMPVIIPPHPSAAVVLGAAMLGRYAFEASAKGPLKTQADADRAGNEQLWEIMVQMTPPAQRIEPRAGELGARERRLLDAKYAIFREAIEIQLRWRSAVDAAA